jgi:ABC-type sugar transport system ATPase subunit
MGEGSWVTLNEEPLSRRRIYELIRKSPGIHFRELQKKLGITTILVTHDQADAFAVGDRVMVLRKGVVQQVGLSEELYDEPRNVFIANFIGDPPMNIFKIPVEHPLLEHLGIKSRVPSQFKEIYVGIRPDEAVADCSPVSGNGVITGKVILTEYLGSRRYGSISIDNVRVKTLLQCRPSPGSTVYIKIVKLHVFSPDGERLFTIQY